MNSNKLSQFLKSNGFYLALVVCVIAAAVSSYLAIDTLMGEITKSPQNSVAQSPSSSYGFANEVDKPQERVPIISESSSANTASSLIESQTPKIEKPVLEPVEEIAVLEETQQQLPAAPTFVMPVVGEIINTFSGDELVYNKTMADWRTHNGTDIAAAIDTAIKTSIAGKVTKVYKDDMWGTVVEVEGVQGSLRYAGLADKAAVSVGQSVNVGDTIGKIGELPAEIAEIPHVHVEAIKGGNYIDFTQFAR